MNLNQRTVTVKLTRKELVDIMILCAYHNMPYWKELHEKLHDQLWEADKKYSREE